MDKTITTRYCDVCKQETKKAGFSQGGGFKVKRDYLDWGGAPVADASISFNDVCDSCLEKIIKVVNKVVFDEQRRAYPHQGDPCKYCKIPHDDVDVGACQGHINMVVGT